MKKKKRFVLRVSDVKGIDKYYKDKKHAHLQLLFTHKLKIDISHIVDIWNRVNHILIF